MRKEAFLKFLAFKISCYTVLKYILLPLITYYCDNNAAALTVQL